MIQFQPDYPEAKLLRRAVRHAQTTKYHIPTLSDLAPKRDLDELASIGRDWQALGLGALIEGWTDGQRSISFSLNDHAVRVVSEIEARTYLGRLKSIPVGKGIWDVVKIGLGFLAGLLTHNITGS